MHLLVCNTVTSKNVPCRGADFSCIQFSKSRSRLKTHRPFVVKHFFCVFSARLRWWSRWGSKPRPQACKARALPAELRPRRTETQQFPGSRLELVGLERFELSTPRLSSVCSNQLSYRPSSSAQKYSTTFHFLK